MTLRLRIAGRGAKQNETDGLSAGSGVGGQCDNQRIWEGTTRRKFIDYGLPPLDYFYA